MKRLLPAFALLAVLVPAAQAGPSCPLITDARGDAAVTGYEGADSAVTRPGDDILDADVWTDATDLHAVVHLAGLPQMPAAGWAAEPQGFWYMVTMDRKGVEPMVEVLESKGRYQADAGWALLQDVRAGQASEQGTRKYSLVQGARFALDPARDLVRLSVPLSAFPSQVVLYKGETYENPRVDALVLTDTATPNQPPDGLGVGRDDATSTRTVVIGSKACAR